MPNTDAPSAYSTEQIWDFLHEVADPEIPVLNIVEMGIARGVDIGEDGSISVRITPTYSGCPAMTYIEEQVTATLKDKGIENFDVVKDFSQAWTTDWFTDGARRKLKEYGIAPPDKVDVDDLSFIKAKAKIIPCPFCDSMDTRLQSEFGSTACKSQYYCDGCHQPFEHFKCI